MRKEYFQVYNRKYLRFLGISFTLLLLYTLAVRFGFLYNVNPEYSGFSDDRNYLDLSFVNERARFMGKSFLWYWIVKALNCNSFLIRLLNIFLIGDVYNRLFKYRRNNPLLYELLFVCLLVSNVVISKEYLILFVVVRILENWKRTGYITISILIGLIALWYLREIYAVLLLSVLLVNVKKRSLLIYFPVLSLMFFWFSWDIQEFIQQNTVRFVELYYEAIHYSLKAESSSLASKYTGNKLYTIFQMITAPVIGKSAYLYNSYFLFPLVTLLTLGSLLKKDFYHNIYAHYGLLCATVIFVLNMGSNYRYKVLYIVLLFCAALLTKSTSSAYNKTIVTLWLFGMIILIFTRF